MNHDQRLRRDELANSLTHAFGLALSIVALAVLIVFARLHGTTRHVVAYSIYGATLVALYAASTAYHGVD